MSRIDRDQDPVLRAVAVVGAALLAGSTGWSMAALLGASTVAGFGLGALMGALGSLLVGGAALSSAVSFTVMAAVVVHARNGGVPAPLLGGPAAPWLLVAGVAGLLVVADRINTDAHPPMSAGVAASARRGVLTRAVAVMAAVLALTTVLTPLAMSWVSRPIAAGDGPRLEDLTGGSNPLVAANQLDMTDRPDLTDAVVFKVDAERATFWRGQTFDRWDGRRWSQSRTRRFELAEDGRVIAEPTDLGVAGDDRLVQRIQMEATYSDVLFAAASAVSVEAPVRVAQSIDGTLVAADIPLGRGATYTVVSRRNRLSEEVLREADGPIPAEISSRYAADPVTTERVRRAARAAVAGAGNNYDRVRALERWMGRRTRYSLDAPLSPRGVDVVDHFLFSSRVGWCEQVASALVVMARVNDIPARLVTGYAPGEAQPLTGTYMVRERDAHAWAEVWFPDQGWVAFDPTASVPLAGTERPDPAAGRWALDHAVQLVPGLVAVGLAVWGLVVAVRRYRERRAARPVGWAAVTDAALVRLGDRSGRPRSDFETATSYARSLARHLSDPRVAEVGAAIDAALYAPVPPDDQARERVTSLLDELLAAEPSDGQSGGRSVDQRDRDGAFSST